VPGLGKHTLAKLNAQHLQLFYARKIDEGLSSTTVHHIHGVIHRALEDAQRMGLVQRNVSEMVKAPRRSHREMHTLSPEEVRRFLDEVHGDRWQALYLLAFSTGMREGELLGLRWQDIDFAHRRLHVRMNVQETLGRYILAETKTTYARRTIGLILPAVTALQLHWERQQAEKEIMGAAYDDKLDLVFANGFGGIMIPHNITKRSFKRHLVAAGLPRSIRFHDARHTAATLLLASGVNVKVVSEMLGHADVSITLRVYAHVLPHMQHAAMNAMEALIGELSPPAVDDDAP
jgi:integrase